MGPGHTARDALDATLRTERDYRELADWSLGRATAYAERADVRGVQSVREAVRERDEKLGPQPSCTRCTSCSAGP